MSIKLVPGHPAEHAIYATRDGRLVEEGDPEASELVVGPGGVVTEKMAARYGGAAEAGTPIPSDAATAVPAAPAAPAPAEAPAKEVPAAEEPEERPQAAPHEAAPHHKRAK